MPHDNGMRYHIVFSKEFGCQQKEYNDLGSFLNDHYVACHAYSINEEQKYQLRGLQIFDMGHSTFQEIKGEQGIYPTIENPIQHMCHIVNSQTNKVILCAFDQFNCYQFTMDPQLLNYRNFQTYNGINEAHLIDDIMNNREAEKFPFKKF